MQAIIDLLDQGFFWPLKAVFANIKINGKKYLINDLITICRKFCVKGQKTAKICQIIKDSVDLNDALQVMVPRKNN